jgi:hypothetical protein
MKRLLLAALSLLAAAAGCSGAEDPSLRGATTLGCEDTTTHRLPVGELRNNMWNKQLAGDRPYRQCLVSRVRDGRTEFGWTWQWPGKDGIYAYPEILVGRSPWMDAPSNDPRFPRRIADTRELIVDHDIESRHEGKRNLAMEMWLTRPVPAGRQAGPADIATELMVWSDASPGMVSKDDKPEATIEVSGKQWAVYVHRNWGDASNGSAHRWSMVSYVAVVPSSTVRYDARAFLQDAIHRGLVDPGHDIADVELGNEIVSGTGSTWLRRFEIEVR